MTFHLLAGLLGAGLDLSAIRLLAQDLARGERSRLRRDIGLLTALYLCLAAAAAGLFAVVYLHLDFFLDSPLARTSQARWAVVLLGAGTAAVIPARAFEAVLAAREDLHLVNLLALAAALANLGLLVVLLARGWGLIGVSLAFIIPLAAQHAALAGMAWRRELAGGGGAPAQKEPGRVREVLAYALESVFPLLLARGKMQAPMLLAGALAGAGATARLGVGLRLWGYGRELGALLPSVMMPRLFQLHASDQAEELRELFLRALRYSLFLAATLALGVALLAEEFIFLWLGPEFAASVTVAQLLAAPMAAFVALAPCASLLYSLRRQRLLIWVNLAELAVMVGVGAVASRWGAIGAAAALALALSVVRPWALPWAACRALGVAGRELWAGPLRSALLHLAAAAPAAALAVAPWPRGSWLGLAGAGVSVALVCTAAFWLLVLPAWEKRYWISAASRRVRACSRLGGQGRGQWGG
jgi:O-antigen/teichoic acid export membrane protein